MEDPGTGRGLRVEFLAVFDDERTFRAWYEHALPKVFGFLFDRCGGVRDVAEELTQETFLEAVRSRHRFDGRSDPVTWLCAIAGHKLIDHWRRLNREEHRRLRLVAARSPVEQEERAFVGAEDRETVLRTLRSLPTQQQAALVLHHLDGLSVAEVAKRLTKSESAVESLLSRGREGFRRALALEGDQR